MIGAPWTPGKLALVGLTACLLVLLGVSLGDARLTEQLFVHASYYLSMLTVLCWVGAHLHAAGKLRWPSIARWTRENWPGIVVAALVTSFAALAVAPALRVLSDEANLVGVSKNLFASRTATFTVSGKYYYESYWDVDVAIDRRPILFPFLVSLVHALLGYSHQNAFLFNLALLPAFLLLVYRLAKSACPEGLHAEVLGVVAALFVAAHPILLISVRSAGFDFLATFFAVLVVKSLWDLAVERTPANLALTWMNLCMFAEVRYESALFILPVLGLTFAFKMLGWSVLRPYALIYALSPAYLLPRVWQATLKGNVPEQEPGIITFSVENFLNNAREYFQPILDPLGAYPAHCGPLILLGSIGALSWLAWLVARLREGGLESRRVRFGLWVTAWMSTRALIVFSYFWGRAQYPSAARLVLALDVFFSFAAAWLLVRALNRFRPFLPVLLALSVLLIQLPVAAQHRMMNRLTQTRESAATWRYFDRLPDKRILIVTDRPNHFTIMGYGATSFESAKRDPYLFIALERRLFQDVYVIQRIELSSGRLLPGYEIWPERELEPTFEFQNDANVLVRVSRVPWNGSSMHE